MRVLHVITPSRVSGAELLLLRLVRAQADLGVTARIVCKPHPGFVERAQREGADCCVLPISGKLNPRAFPALRGEIGRWRPDLLCTHLSSATWWGSLAARSRGVPCVSMVHGFTGARWYRRADRLVCVSRAVAEDMVGQGISAGRVSVVHNGIDPQPYLSAEPADLPVPPGVFVVGTVAHLSPKKGFAELLRAAARVPGAHFVIAGDGPMRPELARAAQAELKGRLHLLGWREDVPALMRRIDAYCLPSRREPFGLVLVEAMAAGRPVVAFRSGGAPEVVVDGETGLLAAPGDADALAACIQRLAGDPQLRRRLGDAGRSRALSHFTLDRQAARLLDEFRSVVAAARP